MTPRYESRLRELERAERTACNAVHKAHQDFLDGKATAADLNRLGEAYVEANYELTCHVMTETLRLAAYDILAGVEPPVECDAETDYAAWQAGERPEYDDAIREANKLPPGESDAFRAMGMATPREGK